MKYLLEYVCVKAINIDGSIEIKYLPFLILKYILMLDYGQTNGITGLGNGLRPYQLSSAAPV